MQYTWLTLLAQAGEDRMGSRCDHLVVVLSPLPSFVLSKQGLVAPWFVLFFYTASNVTK